MSDNMDLNVLELLASKVCHDLISPIGAINNGVELLEEMGAESGDEVGQLIAYSAAQASAKLQAFRMAYGAGGADSSIKIEDVYDAFEAVISHEEKVKQDWDPKTSIGPDEMPKGLCKMLMCYLLLAFECLPKGGIISVSETDEGEIRIFAQGENAGFKENALEALDLKLSSSQLEPKIIHSYVTGMIAQDYGFKLQKPQITESTVTLSFSYS